MTNAFSLYTPRASALHRLHPLTMLALVVFCLVAGLALPGPWGPYVVFLLLILPLAALGQVLPNLLSTAVKIALPFAISVFLIQGLFWTGGTPVVELGPLSLKREGLWFAAQSTGRVLTVVSSFLLLSLTTRPDALMIALDQRGAPKTLTYIVLATIQIAPRFQAKARTILDAQRARGLETEGSVGRRVAALLPLVVPLVLGSIIDIEERAMALDARAFSRSGPKTSLLTLRDTSAQRAGRWLLLLGMIAVVALGIWLRRAA
ncbi:MAG: energy-coupling factor transporter transmembrane protein EcfT [Anaerolineae bacterium]|jgi:energy-coupling factor transport system permease protein|nr:energy-coupling factor transporter transmembrane protein EcfT [Anaerolineae bacterium]